MSAPELSRRFTAMACDVTVRVIEPAPNAEAAMERVEQAFRRIESSCTRFDPQSDLMRANAAGNEWTVVDDECLAAVMLAHDAHVRTGGLFDPRVLKTLVGLGYDRSLDFVAGDVRTEGALSDGSTQAWSPAFDEATRSLRIGDVPVDLGGIGKGYAVRRGIDLLAGAGRGALVEAGGDLATYGIGPSRAGGDARIWRASVEDPRGGSEPIAVIDVTDAAAATSSVRLRRWKASGTDVHHLIDPATGKPSTSELLAVTVVGSDPAWAEVWTKVGFLQGAQTIGTFMERAGLAALWIDATGRMHWSSAMQPRLLASSA